MDKKRLQAIESYVPAAAYEHQALQHAPYTMIVVECSWSDRVFSTSGVAKCGPRDTWSASLGLIIAKGRAIKALTRKVYAWEKRHPVTPLSSVTVAFAAVVRNLERATQALAT